MRKSIFQTAQSLYYSITGIWPIVHISSFLYVTGWKTDLWLVKSSGILIAAIGIALWIDLFQKEHPRSITLLGLLSTGGLLAIDVNYTLTGTISNVYLVDAAIQLVFFLFWSYKLFRRP